ncbi:MAG: hypothetical protein ACM3W4_04865 [Ignavibacteriales bacterium]
MPWGQDQAPASAGGWGRDVEVGKSPSDLARRDAKKYVASTPAPVRQFTEGVTLGFSDELDAAGAALTTGLNNAFRRATGKKPVGYGMGDAYRAVMDEENASNRDFAKAHPVQSASLQIAGGLATPGAGAAGRFVGGAKSLGGAVVRSAAVGGVVGGVAGAGSAAPGESRVAGAKRGAVVGAVTGGALPVAARVAQSAGRAVNAATGYRFTGGPAGAAASRLREALFKDGVDAQTIEQTVREWSNTGAMPPSLADVAGENTRALLRLAGSRPGAGRNMAQLYRDATVEDMPDASIARARKLTPQSETAAEYKDVLTSARGKMADEMYPRFKDDLVPVGDDVTSALSGQSGADALAYAHRIADARRDSAALADIQALADGTAKHVRAGTLDLVRRGLGESAGAEARGNANSVASGLMGRAGDIETALMDVPGFDSARRMYRQMSGEIDAVDAGQRLLKDAPDDFRRSLADATPEALDAARVGARQAIVDALGQRANASPTLRQIAFATNTRQNLIQLFGQDEAEQFIRAARLNLEKARNANFVAPNTGAQTQPRDQDARLLGNVLSAIRHPAEAILNKLANGLTLTDREAEVLVRLGLGKPQNALSQMRPPARVPSALGSRLVVAAPNALAQ